MWTSCMSCREHGFWFDEVSFLLAEHGGFSKLLLTSWRVFGLRSRSLVEEQFQSYLIYGSFAMICLENIKIHYIYTHVFMYIQNTYVHCCAETIQSQQNSVGHAHIQPHCGSNFLEIRNLPRNYCCNQVNPSMFHSHPVPSTTGLRTCGVVVLSLCQLSGAT